MKSFVKNAVGFLITIIICGGLTVASSLGMFSKIEKNFYEPARLKLIRDRLDVVADSSNEYITSILEKFGPEDGGFLSNKAVTTYFMREPSREVGRLFGKLLDDVPGLDGVRIIEASGKSVQYSSYKNDSRNDHGNKTYSNYNELRTYSGHQELPYSVVTAFIETESDDAEYVDEEFSEGTGGEEVKDSETVLPEVNKYRLVFDGNEQRIIISYPYYYDDRSYSVIFYVNPIDFINKLVEQHIISINEQLALISSKDGTAGGFVFGMPKVGQNLLANEILRRWRMRSYGPDEIASTSKINVTGITADENNGQISQEQQKFISWNLISSRNAKFIEIGGLYSMDMLAMPPYIRILLLICSFLTICLIVVILFNIRKDDDIEILSRIKKVQIGLLNEYFENNVERSKVAALIENQRDELTARIKKSLGRRGRKYGEDLTIILNQSWQDIINILAGADAVRMKGLSTGDMTEIRRMFEEVVSHSSLRVQAVTQFPSRQPPKNKKELNTENVSIPLAREMPELQQKLENEVEEIEPVEELEDAEEISEAEPVEELEDAEEISEAEPVEELEDAEEISEAEAEPVEELEDVEEISEAEPVEELEDVEEISEAEPVEELEELEDVEEISEAEPVEELEDVDEISEAEPVEELEDAEEISEAEPVEELEDAEEIPEAEPVEESAASFEVLEESDFVEEIETLEVDDDVEILQEEKEECSPGLTNEQLRESEELLEIMPVDDDNTDVLDAADTNSENVDYEDSSISEFVDVSENIEYSSPRDEVAKFEGTEPLVIGDFLETKNMNSSENDDLTEDFVVYDSEMLFNEEKSNICEKTTEILKASESEELKKNDSTENSMKDNEIEELEEYEFPKELESVSDVRNQFMFTKFAANDNNVTDLPPDAIIQDKDGVFSISENLIPTGVKIDEEFKKLVDSVLR
ncbi:MAG: hypothetical protein SOT45_04195 [Treponema sp.]|nr:hypothetical protein [Treponema sp.]